MDTIYTLGIDVGSTASKCVILKDGKEIVAKSLVDVGAGTSGPARAIAAVLENAGIAVTFGTEVSAIRNRAGDGLCPMETAVWDIEDHESAHRAILTTLQKLQSA